MKSESKSLRYLPRYKISSTIAGDLMKIEAVREAVDSLPLTPTVLASLRESAKLYSTHYSTQIEGNRLSQEQVIKVVENQENFPGRERDQAEVKGYYQALNYLDTLVDARDDIDEEQIQRLHALVMAGGRKRVKPTRYREGQNVIRDSRSNRIVYLPPEAKDVPQLMNQLVNWLNANKDLPVPIRAAVAHYQYATIHPYYDGNGRTARLLTSLVLHLGGYGLKGIYSLEEYYARDLSCYYQAISLGPSHNYYLGRAEADITKWITYFISGVRYSFERVEAQARKESQQGKSDKSQLMRKLDSQQRKALTLFNKSQEIATKELALLLRLSIRSAELLCKKWTSSKFLEVASPSRKSRRYRLAEEFERLFE